MANIKFINISVFIVFIFNLIDIENKINIIPLNIELTIYGLFLVTFSFSVVLTINVVRVPKIAPIINIVKYNITFIFCSFLGLFK